MARGKQQERIPQVPHSPKSTPSRHDKLARLARPNAERSGGTRPCLAAN